MPDVKKEILFHSSMTANKRDPNFAYLRKNCLVPITTPGLYPSKDFLPTAPTNITGSVRNVLGTDVDGYDIKVIATDGTTTRFYNLGSEGESNAQITGSAFRASAFGIDGVYATTANGKVYRAEHDNSSTTEVGDFGSSWLVELGGWDDIYYWWISPTAGIYRQLPNSNPLQIFNGAINGLRGVDFFDKYMIIFTQIGRDIIVLWWDKADNSFFYRRIKIKNSIFLAGGVVDGQLMLVHFVGNSNNRKELAGEIVVSGWDGENFTRLNSILAGTPDLNVIGGSSARQVTFSTGAEVLEFAVDDNISAHNPELYDNYIYRVRKDGSIEVRARPDTTSASIDRASLVRVFHDFSLYTVNTPWQIFTNRDTQTSYEEYDTFRTTEYITNFMENPYNDHKLDALEIAYERIYEVEAPPIDPIPGNAGLLATDNVGPDSLDLLWTKATSNYYAQSELEYKIYLSTSDNIDTIEDMIANGTMVQDWTANISSDAISGLSLTTTYYFNIIVRDPDGNMVAYETTSATTTSLVTAWMSPTATADCEISSTPLPAWANPTNAYVADGVFATSPTGDQPFVAYYDFDFAIDGGATILGIQYRIKGKVMEPPGSNKQLNARVTKVATNPTEYANAIFGSDRQTGAMDEVNTVYTLGGSTDMLSTTWTPAEINDPGFGFLISPNDASVSYGIDHLEVRVFYSL